MWLDDLHWVLVLWAVLTYPCTILTSVCSHLRIFFVVLPSCFNFRLHVSIWRDILLLCCFNISMSSSGDIFCCLALCQCEAHFILISGDMLPLCCFTTSPYQGICFVVLLSFNLWHMYLLQGICCSCTVSTSPCFHQLRYGAVERCFNSMSLLSDILIYKDICCCSGLTLSTGQRYRMLEVVTYFKYFWPYWGFITGCARSSGLFQPYCISIKRHTLDLVLVSFDLSV